ncbi:replication protein P [Shewanella sp. T24-MNA-CIBAN-0130]|uniref:replication protein P n=1 Tax=Shewanella sp. T24-MNA-CIBAN-0130 TaxID=3140470 RepID=UPI003325BF1F
MAIKSLSQTANNAIEYIEQQSVKPHNANGTSLNSESAATGIVNEVFKHLIAAKPAYKQAFKSQAEFESFKQAWTKAFASHGIVTSEQINQGIAQAQKDTSPFFPSIGQFIEWCNPGTLSEVELIEAFTRMVERKKPASDIEHAARLKCGFQCKSLPQDRAFKLFASYMKTFAVKQARGEYIPRRDTPLLENKANSRWAEHDQQVEQRQPRTALEARMQSLRLAARKRRYGHTQTA